ncbi:MAG TPA: hypothetical protein VI318_24720 [Baekduia sp.]
MATSVESPKFSWIAEPKVLELAGVNRSTLQNWVRVGLLPSDSGPGWALEEVMELCLVAELRDRLPLDDLALRWSRMRNDGTVAAIVGTAVAVEGDRFDLVLRTVEGTVTAATTADELAAQVRFPGAPEPVVVLALAPAVNRVKRVYFAWEETDAPPPTERRAGRPVSRRSAANGGTA